MEKNKTIELDLTLIQFRYVKDNYTYINILNVFIPGLISPRSLLGYFNSKDRIFFDFLFFVIGIRKK